MDFDSIVRNLRDQAERAAQSVQEQVKTFAADPFAKARWMDHAFDNAAVAHVFTKLADALDHPTDEAAEAKMARLIEYAQGRAILGQRPQSSSTCSNLIELCEAVAWASAIDYLKGWR